MQYASIRSSRARAPSLGAKPQCAPIARRTSPRAPVIQPAASPSPCPSSKHERQIPRATRLVRAFRERDQELLRHGDPTLPHRSVSPSTTARRPPRTQSVSSSTSSHSAKLSDWHSGGAIGHDGAGSRRAPLPWLPRSFHRCRVQRPTSRGLLTVSPTVSRTRRIRPHVAAPQPNEQPPKQPQKPCKRSPPKPAGLGSPRVGGFDSCGGASPLRSPGLLWPVGRLRAVRWMLTDGKPVPRMSYAASLGDPAGRPPLLLRPHHEIRATPPARSRTVQPGVRRGTCRAPSLGGAAGPGRQAPPGRSLTSSSAFPPRTARPGRNGRGPGR